MINPLAFNSEVSASLEDREQSINMMFPSATSLSDNSVGDSASSYVDGCGTTCSGGCYGGCEGDCAGTRK